MQTELRFRPRRTALPSRPTARTTGPTEALARIRALTIYLGAVISTLTAYYWRMVSSLFPPRLRGQVAYALGGNPEITQADLNILWTSYGQGKPSPDANKLVRADALVKAIGDGLYVDEQLLELLNEVFYFSARGNARRNHAESFKPLLVELMRRNFPIDEDHGIQPPDGTLTLSAPDDATSILTPAIAERRPRPRRATQRAGDQRAIFIVHGRNTAAKEELVKFLRHLDAKPISWPDAAAATGKTRPYTLDIIEAGMNMAQAIVVLFSPDDEARLKSHFHQPGDGPQERKPTGQARQNVTLEAGMAMALAPERTIFVRVGETRDISDILGINWIDLDDNWESRKRLHDALQIAKVKIESGRNLTSPDAGRFSDVAL